MRPKFQNNSQSRRLITHNPNIQNSFGLQIPNTNKHTNKQTNKNKKRKGKIKLALGWLPKSTKNSFLSFTME
jgi:hypothetical protein